MEDYKNILEGTRPFFQGLPMTIPNPSPLRGNSPAPHHSPLSFPQTSPQINPHRMKFEEGLGATLSQMYNTVSSPTTLRIPASSSSPKNNPNSTSPAGGRESTQLHLNLRGGSSTATGGPTLTQSPSSALLNQVPSSVSSSPSLPPRTISGGGNSQSGVGGTGMGIRRESPLDLSVKTVRQSADSSTNNNLPEGTVPPPPSQSSVINSTGTGTRSSSSGASTPNNAAGTVIAAVANSTTGREKEKEARPLTGIPSHNFQPHESVPPTQSVPMASSSGYASPAQSHSHHLFGHQYHSTPNIPTPTGESTHDPSKMYGHHYLQQQQTQYRLPNPTPQSTGSHNYYLPHTASVGTTSTTSTTTSTSRTSSVIPPYNPPQPTFGLSYHHQQQPPSSLAYQPQYCSYNIQQPGPGPGQSPHPYYSPHYVSQSQGPLTNSQTPRNSASTHLNQKTNHESLPSSTPTYQLQGNRPGSSTPTIKPYSTPSHHSQVPPSASPAHSAHYPSYQHFYQSHIGIESQRIPTVAPPAPGSESPRPHAGSATPRRDSAPFPLSYPYAHAQSPAHYNSEGQTPSHTPTYSYQPSPSQLAAAGRSPHPNHYYSYMHPSAGTPRPIPPPQPLTSPQASLPQRYQYPSHLSGPRPPAPSAPLPPAGSQTPTYSSPSVQTPLNVPIVPKPSSQQQTQQAPPTNPKSPGKNSRSTSGGTPKTGEKRKNLLNLLRNSLETRIHEKQEKEKGNTRQTWNFHGKKYHNPLPPPLPPVGGGGGSILTGMSNQGNENHLSTGNGPVGSDSYGPGLFGINQRTNFVERQQQQGIQAGALSPNTENSLNRIRTKAEKKQVFPNLLSQIEQENANKLQSSQPQPPQPVPPMDEVEESRVNLSLSRRSPGRSISPAASTLSSFPLVPPPTPQSTAGPIPAKRRSGSKKFTSKLNKWVPPIGVPGQDKQGKQGNVGTVKNEISVVPVPTTSSYGISSGVETEVKRVPTIDNSDEFWATCDSFLDDLSANPTTIKSRRGGLWAKLKSNSPNKEGKTGKKMRRRRRLSAEVDADFQIEEDDEGEEGKEKGNSETDSDSRTEKSDGVSSADEEIKGQLEQAGSETKSGQSESEGGVKGGKRKSSTKSRSPPKKKKKRASSGDEVKGRKVGKRLLRERRTGSVIGKSMSDLDSSGESDDDESDVSVASFSISSDDSVSVDSDSSTDNSDDSNSECSGGGGGDGHGVHSDQSITSKGETSKRKKKKVKKGSSSGRRRSTRNSSLKSSGQRNGRAQSVTGKGKHKRKLRPTRNCAKGKNKALSGESDEERGSSGEEWIMRGELGKRKREKSRVVYGDGSEFKRPGWEEELIDFKKKLRMPTKLIRVAKPSSLTSSTPSTKDKERKEEPEQAVVPVVVVSPSKSTKENKSPTKSESSVPAEPQIFTPTPPPTAKKGRPAKVKTPSKEGNDKPKKSPKTPKTKKTEKSVVVKTKGKKIKLNSDEALTPTPNGTETVTPVVSLSVLREDRDKGMTLLPTPGAGGAKFNKKMSIKSVFGVDPPTPTPPVPAPQPPPPNPNPLLDIPSTQSSPASASVPKKALRRNKFKSGFDYIRKKKKTPADSSTLPPPPKRLKVSLEKNTTEDDVQNELRCWVLNKGLGETVLHRAARLGYPDVAAYALEHDICSPNCKDNAGYSPLHETCMKGNLDVAKILLAYGANPSQAAPGGIRPLHEACENGHVELVRLLISFGADPLLATYAGQTPMELAEHHKAVKRLLEQHIRDVQGKEEKPWEFRGSGKWADDRHDSGYDVTVDPPFPSSTNSDSEEGFEFEATELPLPPIYMLNEDVPHILLQDLINYLGLPKDRILKSHPGAEFVELNSNDFLEDVHCRTLLGVKFRLNLSSDLLVLIKYDDVVKKMLNIETSFIK